jgi:hypothetical protein
VGRLRVGCAAQRSARNLLQRKFVNAHSSARFHQRDFISAISSARFHQRDSSA